MCDLLEQAKSIQSEIVKWRRHLHQIPEIGNELPETSKYVQQQLKEMDIPFTTMVNGSGIVALIKGGSEGKTVALRADMDALPIAEEAPVDFKSSNGNMHACGHDSHAAMLLGAAKLINGVKDTLKGNVKLIFQPGEESPGGAKIMIEEGCLENPKVDAIFGQHIGCLMDYAPVGSFVIPHGNLMASRDSFKIKIKGRGAHSSTPQDSVDPVNVAAQVINAVNSLKAREMTALSPAVISICMIHGGSASNIIPETLEMEGSTRAIEPAMRDFIEKRIGEVVENTCKAYGATCEYTYFRDYDVTTNNDEMADFVKATAIEMFSEDEVMDMKGAIMGSEDMSFYLNKIPGAYYFFSSSVAIDGVVYGHHNPKFMLDESVFYKGTALMAKSAIKFLNK